MWWWALAGALVMLAALVVEGPNPRRSLSTLRRLDDYPLYTMRYFGNYNFSAYLEKGEPAFQKAQAGAGGEYACTCFAALGDPGGRLVGRNFDWYDHPMMLLFTDPPDGYASAAMVDLSYVGFKRGEEPAEEQLEALLRAAPYLSFDGMNEHGLAVGMMAVPHAEAQLETGFVTLDSLAVIRLVLDRARTVEEALSLMGQYNVDFGGGPPIHYLIADAGGHSVVVEYLNNEMVALRNEGSWQVATNFLLEPVAPAARRENCPRYRAADEVLQAAGGALTTDEAMRLLERVSGDGTLWSVVYDMSRGAVYLSVGRNYERVYRFAME